MRCACAPGSWLRMNQKVRLIPTRKVRMHRCTVTFDATSDFLPFRSPLPIPSQWFAWLFWCYFDPHSLSTCQYFSLCPSALTGVGIRVSTNVFRRRSVVGTFTIEAFIYLLLSLDQFDVIDLQWYDVVPSTSHKATTIPPNQLSK